MLSPADFPSRDELSQTAAFFQGPYQPSAKSLRARLFRQTLKATKNAQYFSASGVHVPLDAATIERSVVHSRLLRTLPPLSEFPPLPDGGRTEISVVCGDCVEAGAWLVSQGLRPALLNMAASGHAGGGVGSGAGAQEENLCRRSTLFAAIADFLHIVPADRGFYPLPEFGGILSPDVVFFRGAEDKGYPFLEAPFLMSVISCAAYSHPPVNRRNRLAAPFDGKTKRKINAVLSMGMEAHCDALVLSAFGCGAFCNPPQHMAELFAEVIASAPNRFRHICFAIFDDHNAHGAGNYAPFAEVFGRVGATLYPQPPWANYAVAPFSAPRDSPLPPMPPVTGADAPVARG